MCSQIQPFITGYWLGGEKLLLLPIIGKTCPVEYSTSASIHRVSSNTWLQLLYTGSLVIQDISCFPNKFLRLTTQAEIYVAQIRLREFDRLTY